MAATYTDQPQQPHETADIVIALTTITRLIGRLPRVVRFAAVGGTCAALQLLVLEILVHLHIELHLANTLAFLLSTQVNFLLSSAITWRDRLEDIREGATVGKRLAGYNLLALGSLAINQAVFALALHVSHYLVASACGILAGMLLTYTISGLVLFRRAAVANECSERQAVVA